MTDRMSLTGMLSELGPRFEDGAAGNDAEDRFVAANYAALRERGAFSALVPPEFGGGGAGHAEMCGFLRGLAGHCPSTALALSMHQHLVAAAVANHRAGRPGRALLEKVGATQAILVSTGANDWLDSNGEARPVEDGYLVSAVKPFASGGPVGDVLVTSAVCRAPGGAAEVLHFPVPLGADGVTLKDDWRSLGMRATGSGTVVLKDVLVPAEAVALRRPQGPFHPAFAVILTVAMPLIMSVYLGTAERAAAIAREMAGARADDPATQVLAGEMENRRCAAALAVDDLVRLANGLDFTPDAALAGRVLTRKTLAANAVIATAEKALELAGGAGFFRKAGLERLLRDVHGAQFHPLPEKRQHLFTGRMALGRDPIRNADGPLDRAA